MKWYGYAIAASALYGLHQIFTKLASTFIGEGAGAFVVELTAALTILAYLGYLRILGAPPQPITSEGVAYSIATGVCVGIGTIVFFIMFQKGGPLSAVPMILAGGAALMALAGMTFFGESRHLFKWAGVTLSIAALFLLRLSDK